MCGLFGFNGIKNFDTRLKLVKALGLGADSRGYSAAGFVTTTEEGTVVFNRKVYGWTNASPEFLAEAATGPMCMGHSRAPFGPATDAHPFPITRKDSVVLWGAHNGGISNAWENAKKNNRHITVDSMEIFELLGDRDFAQISNLRGWGVVTWVEAHDPHNVRIAKLTRHSDMVAVSIEGGGVVWGSTAKIIGFGLAEAGLIAKEEIYVGDVGTVYLASKDTVTPTDEPNMQININNYC